LNGTIMCLVGLLRLLQVRSVLTLPSAESAHPHRKTARVRLAPPPYKTPNRRSSRNHSSQAHASRQNGSRSSTGGM